MPNLKNVMRIFIFILIYFVGQNLKSQNLVQNFNFEEYLVCPKEYTKWNSGKILIPYWTYPSKGTPDYFNKCSKSNIVSVPKNFTGYREAHSGNAYAGIVLRGTNSAYREYLQTELSQRLIKNKLYCFSMYYSLSDRSGITINRLGVVLSQKAINVKNEGVIPQKPIIGMDSISFLQTSSQWNLFCKTFRANGNEKFLSIGNFYSSSETKIKNIESVVKNKKLYCYILIDDVILKPIDSCTNCLCFESDLQIRIIERDSNLLLNVKNAELPYRVQWYNGNNTLRINKPKDGNYFVNIVDGAGCKDEISFQMPLYKKTKIDTLNTSAHKLKKLEKGEILKLKNIHFQSNSAEILVSSTPEIDVLADYMKRNKSYKIQIYGNTDNQGTMAHNQKLSEARAKAVVDYLISKGIEKDRLSFKGNGSNNPIANNSTVSGRKLNRRVEVKLLSK